MNGSRAVWPRAWAVWLLLLPVAGCSGSGGGANGEGQVDAGGSGDDTVALRDTATPAAPDGASDLAGDLGIPRPDGTAGDAPGTPVDSGGPPPAGRVAPSDFAYLGAFRLPGGDDRPETFHYGGNAMTFRPDGDPGGEADGFPGSLFVMGHDRLAYGELPDGSQVAEVSIPAPVVAESAEGLSRGELLQGFGEVAGELFEGLDEIPRVGMEYLSHPAVGAKIHLAWGAHFQEDVAQRLPSHAWFDPDLSAPAPQGSWFIGEQSLYSVNGYLFEIPASWADAHVGGRMLGTGRYRDGGWSGRGPSLFAYVPWTDDAGTPAPAGTRLEERVLLRYESSLETDDVVERSMVGYQHADEWEGGAFLTTRSGKSAVLFAGTKGTGSRFWYGWVHPDGDLPCVEVELVDQFTTCYNADGSPCPESDLGGCEDPVTYRGWWSASFAARFALYDPGELARVAAGELAAWEPQPYANVDVDDYFLLPSVEGEAMLLGRGAQRRYRTGAVAFDRANGLLYVLELFADAAKPVVHVFRVN